MFVDAIVCAVDIEADVVSCICIVQLYLKANARTSQAPAAYRKYQILGEPPGSRTQIERALSPPFAQTRSASTWSTGDINNAPLEEEEEAARCVS